MRLEGAKRTQYVEAWQRWRADVDALHKVLLDGEPADSLHLVALLRRESKSKERYDEARVSALGLPPPDDADDVLFAPAPATPHDARSGGAPGSVAP